MERLKYILIIIIVLFSTEAKIAEEAFAVEDDLYPETVEELSLKPVVFSALVPGAGQIYTGQYVRGGTIIAFEAITGLSALYWNREHKTRELVVDDLRDSLALYKRRMDGVQGERLDSLRRRYIHLSLNHSGAAHISTEALYRSYNALAWMTGGYIYSLFDAASGSGIFKEKNSPGNPVKAAWLAAIPGLGLGQLYNGQISKAGMIMMTQFSLGITALNYNRLMNNASRHYNILRDQNRDEYAFRNEFSSFWAAKYDAAFSNRNTFLWYSLAFYLYSILDAVVDAHLSDFNNKTGVRPDIAVDNSGVAFTLSFALR